MRKFLGFGVVLTVACLIANSGVAYGQKGAAAQAENAAAAALNPNQTPSPSVPAQTNLEQQAAQAAGLTNPATTTPAVPGQAAPAVPGLTTGAVPGQMTGT